MKKENKALTLYGILLGLLLAGLLLTAFFGAAFGVLAQGLGLVLLIVGRGAFVSAGPEEEKPHLETIEIGDIQVPTNMPLPYAVLSLEGGILRYNSAFETLCGGGDLRGTTIGAWLPEYRLGEDEQTLCVGENRYRVFCKTTEVMKDHRSTGNEIYTLCFVDVSATGRLEAAIEKEKTAVGLVYIDNYDEALSTVDDTRAPLLTALIDRKLTSLAEQNGGFIKKLEKDRYLCVLSRGSLEQLMEKRFEVLSEVKTVSIGDHIPITLSLGFGVSHVSLDEAMKDARSAMDLALGRGGDQAIVKEKGRILFFGGKSGEVVHNARIRARIKAEAFMELLAESDMVFVMGHRNADLDSLGAALGVFRMAKSVNKPCHILLESDRSGVLRLCSRLAEQEDYRDLFISTETAVEQLTERSLTVVVDTHIPELVESPTLLEDCRRVVVLDHHRKSASFIEKAILVYHEPYASSTAELVTEMIQYQGERVKLKKVEADALLGGMTVDTRNFSGKTGAITFETAAYLKRHGADSVRVRLLLQNGLEEYKARAQAVQSAELFADRVAIAVCPEGAAANSVMAAQTADELLDIVGVQASFVLCRVGDVVHVSARSLGELNVQVVMESLGGGGHQTVAGGQFPGARPEDVKEKIQHAVTAYLQEEEPV